MFNQATLKTLLKHLTIGTYSVHSSTTLMRIPSMPDIAFMPRLNIQGLIALVTFTFMLSGCTAYYPYFKGDEPQAQKNGVELYKEPYYQKSITPVGWTTNILLSASAGYAAYAYAPYTHTQDALGKTGLMVSSNTTRMIHGAAAGLLTGWITHAIMNSNRQVKPLVTLNDASQWQADFDNRRKVVEFKSNAFIRSIPVDGDQSFVMENIADARSFKEWFPNSPVAEEVVARSLSNIAADDRDDLVAIFPTLDISTKIKQQLINESRTLSEWIELTNRYSGVINKQNQDVTDSKVKGLIKNLSDLQTLVRTRPTYVSLELLQQHGLPFIQSRSDIRSYKSLFPSNPYDSALAQIAFNTVSNLGDAVEVKELLNITSRNAKLEGIAFDNVRSISDAELFLKEFAYSDRVKDLPERAQRHIRSATDVITFSRLFPRNEFIDKNIEMLLASLSRTDADKLLTELSSTSQRAKLIDVYVKKSTDLNSAIEANAKYPGNQERLASQVVSTLVKPGHYRKFLSVFGETETAFDARRRYYDMIGDTPENLGPNINTEYEEYAPKVTPDGETLYFCRRDDPDGSGGEDIYVSVLDADGEWAKAQNIGAPLNDGGPNSVTGSSQDGNYLLIHDGSKSVGFATTDRVDREWTQPTPLSIPNFYSNSTYHNGCLSSDGKSILMSVSLPGTIGGNDLYVTHLTDNGWSTPVSLGPTINTTSEESSVFLAADGETIYFSSDGHGGYGGSDVLMARRLDESWEHWSEPENLGPRINGPNNERFYVIPASGDYVYYSSYNGDKKDDIYRIGLPIDKRPKPVTLVKGSVLNGKTGKPLAAVVHYEDLESGKELGTVKSDPASGTYKIILPSGRRYGFYAETPGYFSENTNVDLTDQHEYRTTTQDLTVVPIESGQTVPIRNVFFETGKTQLAAESSLELNRLVAIIQKHSNFSLEISGHTDDVGTDENNKSLSDKRANAVLKYLTSKGVSANRVVAVGYGESKPLVPNDSEYNRSLNRRVEFTVR